MGHTVSVILNACNQGSWVRKTVPWFRAGLRNTPHEIIVVDDSSIDGCCRRIDQQTLILRPDYRLGVSQSRQWAATHARGDVMLFSDAHCYFAPGDLARLVVRAASTNGLVQPIMRHLRDDAMPTSDIGDKKNDPGGLHYGGRLYWDRGLLNVKPNTDPRLTPVAWWGSVCAMRRNVYDKIGGWPSLPGVWGWEPATVTLLLLRLGIPIVVCEDVVGAHYHTKKRGRYRFSVELSDLAQNGHYCHAGLLPNAYEIAFREQLITRYRKVGKPATLPLKSEAFSTWRKFVADHASVAEKIVVAHVAATDGESDVSRAIAQQQERSKPGKYTRYNRRIDAALEWMKKNTPGCLKGRSGLDVGTRDGYALDWLDGAGMREVEGIELVPDVAAYARNRLGRNVRQGDILNLPYQNDSWNYVTSMHTLEHAEDPHRAVNELVRVMSPAGRILITVPLETSASDNPTHNYVFASPDQLRGLLEANSDIMPESIVIETAPYTDNGEVEIRALAKKVHKVSAAVRRRRREQREARQRDLNRQN